MHQNDNSLHVSIKPSLLAPFTARMDGVSVSRFLHQLSIYFSIVELNDDVEMSSIAITLLEGTAYN